MCIRIIRGKIRYVGKPFLVNLAMLTGWLWPLWVYVYLPKTQYLDGVDSGGYYKPWFLRTKKQVIQAARIFGMKKEDIPWHTLNMEPGDYPEDDSPILFIGLTYRFKPEIEFHRYIWDVNAYTANTLAFLKKKWRYMLLPRLERVGGRFNRLSVKYRDFDLLNNKDVFKIKFSFLYWVVVENLQEDTFMIKFSDGEIVTASLSSPDTNYSGRLWPPYFVKKEDIFAEEPPILFGKYEKDDPMGKEVGYRPRAVYWYKRKDEIFVFDGFGNLLGLKSERTSLKASNIGAQMLVKIP